MSTQKVVLQYKHKRTINCTYQGAIHSSKSLAFSPGGQYVSAAIGSSICVWNCETGEKEFEMPWDNAKALSVAWTHKRQFLGGFCDGMLLAATIDVAKVPNHTLTGFDPLDSPIEFIALHHSHSSIALGGNDIVQIWKPKESHTDLKHVMTIPPPATHSRGKRKVQVTSIGWIDSDKIVVSYLNNGILVWRVNAGATGPNVYLRPESELPVRNLCPRGLVAPDGRHFVASNKTNTFHIYDINAGLFLHSFKPDGDSDEPLSHRPAAFVHGGTALLGASGRKVFLWDIDTFVNFHAPLSVPSGQLLQLAGECDALTNQFLIAGSTTSGQINIWKSHQVVPNNSNHKLAVQSSCRSFWLCFAITFILAYFLHKYSSH